MERSRAFVFSLLLLIGILTGCTERMELELDETYARLVVDGEITSETRAHCVRLTTSNSFLGEEPDLPVQGASVRISDSHSIHVMKEDPDEPGHYYTDAQVRGIPGEIYLLDIVLPEEINGTDHYTAACPMLPVAQLDSIGIVWKEQWEVWEIQCFALDPPTTDFYLFDILINDILVTDTINERFVIDDRFFNGNYTNGAGIGYLSPDEGENLQPGDKITVRTSRISKEYYDYFWEVVSETGYKNPLFGGPPANIKGNISNGGIGFFLACPVSETSAINEEGIAK